MEKSSRRGNCEKIVQSSGADPCVLIPVSGDVPQWSAVLAHKDWLLRRKCCRLACMAIKQHMFGLQHSPDWASHAEATIACRLGHCMQYFACRQQLQRYAPRHTIGLGMVGPSECNQQKVLALAKSRARRRPAPRFLSVLFPEILHKFCNSSLACLLGIPNPLFFGASDGWRPGHASSCSAAAAACWTMRKDQPRTVAGHHSEWPAVGCSTLLVGRWVLGMRDIAVCASRRGSS